MQSLTPGSMEVHPVSMWMQDDYSRLKLSGKGDLITMWKWWKEKKPVELPAYDRREQRALQEIAQLGVGITKFLIEERRRNHYQNLKATTMLRDIDDIDTITLVVCKNCGKPMAIRLNGIAKSSTLALRCCDTVTRSSVAYQTIETSDIYQ